jgi:predicted regulator of amino acid metabolism with ACT domain
MLILIENIFKDSPSRKKIVEGLFNMGISIRAGRFWIGPIEIPTSEIAKAFSVNRRTVYETIRQIKSNYVIATIMANVTSDVNCTQIAPLIGNQVIEIDVATGLFQKVFAEFSDFIASKSINITEVLSRTDGKKKSFIRAVTRNILQDQEIEDLSKIKGVLKIRVSSPDLDSPNYLCKVCEVVVCPNKVSSPLQRGPMQTVRIR